MESERLLCCRPTPKWYQNDSDYFMTNLLILFKQAIFPRGRAPYQKWLVVHLDNCSVHTSRFSIDWLEEHGMRRMPHQFYSHYLVRSDFYLFLAVKESSNGFNWLTRTSFFECL
jgi:hypothetical protein